MKSYKASVFTQLKLLERGIKMGMKPVRRVNIRVRGASLRLF